MTVHSNALLHTSEMRQQHVRMLTKVTIINEMCCRRCQEGHVADPHDAERDKSSVN